MKLSRVSVLLAVFVLGLHLVALAGTAPILVSTTSWGFPEDLCLRGLSLRWPILLHGELRRFGLVDRPDLRLRRQWFCEAVSRSATCLGDRLRTWRGNRWSKALDNRLLRRAYL